ncbi:MAG: hypothetical protein ACKO6N_29360 [Myxococcota bacterium]
MREQAEGQGSAERPTTSTASSAQPEPVSRSGWLGLAVLLLSLFGLGLFVRLQMLDSAVVNADSISPYLKALMVETGRRFLPQGPFPESGYIFAWIYLPYLLLADSLREAFALRFAFHACLAPMLAGGVWWSLRRILPQAPGLALIPAGLTGIFLALSPGLADTLLTGYQTFDAPVYAAFPILGMLLALYGGPSRLVPWLILPFLPILAMIHPFASIYTLALLPFMAWEIRHRGLRPFLPAFSVAVLIALPHLIKHLAPLLRGPEAFSEHFWQIAHSPGRYPSLWAALWKVAQEELLSREPWAHGLLLVTPLWGWLSLPLLKLGLHDPVKQENWQKWVLWVSWVSLLPLSLVLLASQVEYLQPYHARLLYPAYAVLWGIWAGYFIDALSRMHFRLRGGGALTILLLSLGVAWQLWTHRYPPPASGADALAFHTRVAARIQADAGPRGRVMNHLYLSNELRGSPGGLMLEQRLTGVSEGALRLSAEQLEHVPVYLLVFGKPEGLAQALSLCELPGCRVLAQYPEEACHLLVYEHAEAVRQFAASLCAASPLPFPVRVGGANDYLSALNLEHDTAQLPSWFAACPAP